MKIEAFFCHFDERRNLPGKGKLMMLQASVFHGLIVVNFVRFFFLLSKKKEESHLCGIPLMIFYCSGVGS